MAAPTIVQDPPLFNADIVGHAFARQYYTILQQSPALVHRFYQDISKLGRTGDDDAGVMSSTTTMDAINEKIQSYGSLKADVKYVDAQESYNGGVIVLVTGSMVNDDESRRGFTQTFFLAPQDKGFFVLNDIFRYVEDDSHQNERQDNGIAPTTPETLPVKENHITVESNGEVYNPHENGEVQDEKEEEDEPVAEVVDEAPNDVKVVIGSTKGVDEVPNDSQAPKKSYASIVMKDTPVTAPSPNFPKSTPKVQEQHLPVTQAPVAIAPPSSADVNDDSSNHESEGEGHSIYIRNLPVNVPYDVVEETFKRFGPVRSGGIQIRHNKGFCFGFVEFEGASAARSAIEASPVSMAGREIVVEEKKSSSRGSSRGRYPTGRGGGGFRGDGGRGRGSYGGGGRGYGRGESNRNDFGNRGGSRGYNNRSEGFHRSDQTGNGGGRMSRGGGSGIGNTRAPRVPAQA